MHLRLCVCLFAIAFGWHHAEVVETSDLDDGFYAGHPHEKAALRQMIGKMATYNFGGYGLFGVMSSMNAPNSFSSFPRHSEVDQIARDDPVDDKADYAVKYYGNRWMEEHMPDAFEYYGTYGGEAERREPGNKMKYPIVEAGTDGSTDEGDVDVVDWEID